MQGSPRQIEWATKIKETQLEQFKKGIDGLKRLKVSNELISQAKICYETCAQCNDAKTWIDNRQGKMYSIAASVGLLYTLRHRLGWTAEEEKIIGFGFFNKIGDYVGV